MGRNQVLVGRKFFDMLGSKQYSDMNYIILYIGTYGCA